MGKSLIIIILLSVLIIDILDSQIAFGGVCTVDKDGDGHCLDPPVGTPPDLDDENPCMPDPNVQACINSKPVGGEIIPIDTIPLLLAGAQNNLVWILPLLLGGIGFAVFSLRKN